jgi:crotonobetainyl-CoA:carnitine CoA-transferase CaiB-like acyl-CoA transferase
MTVDHSEGARGAEMPATRRRPDASLPLAGLRVVEFSHMIMGPTCGMILGDLGADVIKVEPPEGDNTRRLIGAGAGFFRLFNRNKKSLAVDLGRPEGLAVAHRLVGTADVVIENFRPGGMAKYGLDYASLAVRHPGLIYVAHKGFLPGPYEHRVALDEVVQMMGGLAYMTGPPGKPLRAGSSVNDIMGGMFGVIGVLAALRERDRTGHGAEVQSALFENCVLLSGQHMQQFAVTGTAPAPMPSRSRAWGVYDVFSDRNGDQIFLGVVTDTQWRIFCDVFGLAELGVDPRLATNNQRVLAHQWLIPRLAEAFSAYTVAELQERFERNGLPFAPIVRPEQLFEDPHLTASGGLAPFQTDGSGVTAVPLLPITLGGERLPPRMPLAGVGEHTREILEALGYDAARIEALAAERTVVCSPAHVQAKWDPVRR